jgi:hypothetical protein
MQGLRMGGIPMEKVPSIGGLSSMAQSNLALEMQQLADFSVEDFVQLHEGDASDWFNSTTPAPARDNVTSAAAPYAPNAAPAAAHEPTLGGVHHGARASATMEHAISRSEACGSSRYSPTEPSGTRASAMASGHSALLGEHQGVLSADGRLTIAPTPAMLDALLGPSPIPPSADSPVQHERHAGASLSPQGAHMGVPTVDAEPVAAAPDPQPPLPPDAAAGGTADAPGRAGGVAEEGIRRSDTSISSASTAGRPHSSHEGRAHSVEPVEREDVYCGRSYPHRSTSEGEREGEGITRRNTSSSSENRTEVGTSAGVSHSRSSRSRSSSPVPEARQMARRSLGSPPGGRVSPSQSYATGVSFATEAGGADGNGGRGADEGGVLAVGLHVADFKRRRDVSAGGVAEEASPTSPGQGTRLAKRQQLTRS